MDVSKTELEVWKILKLLIVVKVRLEFVTVRRGEILHLPSESKRNLVPRVFALPSPKGVLGWGDERLI